MEDKEFRKLLEQTHQEIEHTRNVGDKEKALLRDLSGDIRELLDRSEGVPGEVHPSVIQRLEESIDTLEATHPTLTATMSRLLAILSNAGI
jgi:hypothetical protein